MASLAATLAEDFRTEWNAEFDKNEQTRPVAGAYKMALEDSKSAYSFVTQELLEKARNAAGVAVKIPALNYDSSVTISSTRPLTISDDENVSALYELTFVIYTMQFTMIPARHKNNSISYQADFNRKMRKGLFAMEKAMDTATLTKLNTNKNQVDPDLLGKYSVASNVLTVPKSYEDTFYSDLEILLMSNELNEEGAPINVVGNPYVASKIKYLGQQGGGNYANLAYQFDGKDFYFTNQLSNGAGQNGAMYFMPKGSLGLVTRSEPDALIGSRTGDGHEWDIIPSLPIINMPADSYYYTAAVNADSVDTSTAHLTRAMKEYFSYSVEMAILTPYNSDLTTVPSAIQKAAILAS